MLSVVNEKSELKKKSTAEIRAYLRKYPDCSYEELVKTLKLNRLSKPWFYALRSQAKQINPRKNADSNAPPGGRSGVTTTMTVEILDTIDSSGFSDEVKLHYQSHILPLLKRVVPDGFSIQLVELIDPPSMEIRKIIS